MGKDAVIPDVPRQERMVRLGSWIKKAKYGGLDLDNRFPREYGLYAARQHGLVG